MDRFPFSQATKADTIKVKVNGSLISDYSYDAESHSIKFNAGSIPVQGSEIIVSY